MQGSADDGKRTLGCSCTEVIRPRRNERAESGEGEMMMDAASRLVGGLHVLLLMRRLLVVVVVVLLRCCCGHRTRWRHALCLVAATTAREGSCAICATAQAQEERDGSISLLAITLECE